MSQIFLQNETYFLRDFQRKLERDKRQPEEASLAENRLSAFPQFANPPFWSSDTWEQHSSEHLENSIISYVMKEFVPFCIDKAQRSEVHFYLLNPLPIGRLFHRHFLSFVLNGNMALKLLLLCDRKSALVTLEPCENLFVSRLEVNIEVTCPCRFVRAHLTLEYWMAGTEVAPHIGAVECLVIAVGATEWIRYF